MNYRDTLNKAREQGIDIFALHIADETGAFFGDEHPDFERLCFAVSELYLNTYHISCEAICGALRYALRHGDVILENIRKGTEDFDLVVELACSMD